MRTKFYVIITAGGSGVRMGGAIPKQFLDIQGRPILLRTIEVFEALADKPEMVLTLPAKETDSWKALCIRYGREDLSCRIIPGGLTRFHSVKAALAVLPHEGKIVVHDGVRPLISPKWLQDCLKASLACPALIPVLPVTVSLRKIEGPLAGNTHTVPVMRDGLFEVQTPQIFDAGVLQQAYRQVYDPAFTDDATVVEKTGVPLRFTAGSAHNLKITRPDDLRLAEALLSLRR